MHENAWNRIITATAYIHLKEENEVEEERSKPRTNVPYIPKLTIHQSVAKNHH